ncbi:MAG: HAMP domain-containing sensor histidine kinase [Polyangiaceae bacterium]
MSLRLRLLLVVVLALGALLVAGLSLAAVVRQSRAATVAAMTADTEAAALALARASSSAPLAGSPRTPETRSAIHAAAAAVLAPLHETRGGYCFRDGDFIEAESASFRRGGPPPGPPPDGRGAHDGPPGPPPHVREALVEACKRAVSGKVEQVDTGDRGDDMIVIVAGIDERSAAFAVRIVPVPRSRRGVLWWAVLVGLPIVTLVIVGISIETMLALRRGVTELDAGLARLQDDLRGDITRPRAQELAEIADRLRSMANRLANARDRELALERKVAHEARLGSLGRLVAGVAHEIRNPLTGIKLLLDGMRRRELDRRTDRDVQTCLAEIARLGDIVTAFLGIARDARAERVEIDLAELCAERATAAAAMANSREITITCRGDARVIGERDAVVQIVDNLLRNAVEASPDGAEVEVVVARGATGDASPASLGDGESPASLGDGESLASLGDGASPASSAGARIEVIDRGEGVPMHLADDLFEPFVTSKPGGTGLGLWISYTAATSRGGDLKYDRASDRTRFTLTLPSRPQ